MNPVKSFVAVSSWLLRIFVLLLVYQKYFDTFITFTFKGLYYYLVFAMVLFAVVLFIGGFVKKHHFSIISGFIIFGISGFLMFWPDMGIDKAFYHFPLMVLGFNFIARGNS